MTERIEGKHTTVEDIKLINLPRVDLSSGALTSINSGKEVPFDIQRVYYLYDVPNKSDRGAHAHKELYQLIVAASGSFEVEIDDSNEKRLYVLRQPDEGLLVPPGLWRDLKRFSGGAICLVLASHPFDESDYIRDYNEYLNFKIP
ncbi:MAG TPA: hypothetical protein DCR48_02905 [Flavobacteriales bacterium]|nr:hypothetical protein [Flavobacteriales bacterium]